MIAYLDASVVLRLVLGQSDALAEWDQVEEGVASALAEVECLRTLDRLRLAGGVAEEALAERRATVLRLFKAIEVVEPTRPVLNLASQPMPTTLGTLDAIHLASALLWREAATADLVMATHDTSLARAARSFGFAVIGC